MTEQEGASALTTRVFSSKIGFDEESHIRQFYGPDDDEVTSWKALGDL